MYTSNRWEDRYGAIQGSTVLLENVLKVTEGQNFSEIKDLPATKEMMTYMWDNVVKDKYCVLLVDPEFRVRTAIGILLRETMKSDKERGIATFD